MKKLLMMLVVFMLGSCAANAATHYEVHVQGSTQPYICTACSLRIPYPEKETADIISAWQAGKAPFADSSTHHGTKYSPIPGDIVNVCNACGCSTYTLDNTGLWGMGIFRATEAHPVGTSLAPSEKNASSSKRCPLKG